MEIGRLEISAAISRRRISFIITPPINSCHADLIQQILWVEISDCYYSEDHDMLDPCDCDEAVETLVYSRMKPRLEKLPRKWDGLLEEFFADPDRHN